MTITRLPYDSIYHILNFLGPKSTISFAYASRWTHQMSSQNEVLRKAYWSISRKLPLVQGISVARLEHMYQEIKIPYPKLIQALGGLDAVFKFPKVTEVKSILTGISQIRSPDKISRGVDQFDRPFIIFRYVIVKPNQDRSQHIHEVLYKSHANEWHTLYFGLLSQITFGAKNICDHDVEEKVLERVAKLVEGIKVGILRIKQSYTCFFEPYWESEKIPLEEMPFEEGEIILA